MGTRSDRLSRVMSCLPYRDFSELLESQRHTTYGFERTGFPAKESRTLICGKGVE